MATPSVPHFRSDATNNRNDNDEQMSTGGTKSMRERMQDIRVQVSKSWAHLLPLPQIVDTNQDPRHYEEWTQAEDTKEQKITAMEDQRRQFEEWRATETRKQKRQFEDWKAAEVEKQRRQFEDWKAAEVEKQRRKFATMKSDEMKKQKGHFKNWRTVEMSNLNRLFGEWKAGEMKVQQRLFEDWKVTETIVLQRRFEDWKSVELKKQKVQSEALTAAESKKQQEYQFEKWKTDEMGYQDLRLADWKATELEVLKRREEKLAAKEAEFTKESDEATLMMSECFAAGVQKMGGERHAQLVALGVVLSSKLSRHKERLELESAVVNGNLQPQLDELIEGRLKLKQEWKLFEKRKLRHKMFVGIKSSMAHYSQQLPSSCPHSVNPLEHEDKGDNCQRPFPCDFFVAFKTNQAFLFPDLCDT